MMRAISKEESRGEMPQYLTVDAGREEERALVCSVAMRPELIDGATVRAEMLLDPTARECLIAIDAMRRSGVDVDITSLTSTLTQRGRLAAAGGMAEIALLLSTVPGPANFPYYLDIVTDRWRRRVLHKVATEIVSRSASPAEAVEAIDADARRALDAVSAASMNYTQLAIDDLATFDSRTDPNCLVGDRWLTRGSIAMLVGASGLGKSSLAMQLACTWAVPHPFCGIEPKRAMRTLIMQAENDLGDMAEMFQGVVSGLADSIGMGRDDLLEMLRDRVSVVRDVVSVGAEEFGRQARRLINIYRPDIVMVDPVLSYVGDDVTEQRVAAKFLRTTLNMIAAETGVAWLLLHHTPKPPSDGKGRKGWTDSDYSYSGAGSAEWTNAPRAIAVLSQTSTGGYKLLLPKRGRRANATHPDGTPTTAIYLRHATYPSILWVQESPPIESEVPAGGAAKRTHAGRDYTTADVERHLDGEAVGVGELGRLVMEQEGMSRATYYRLWGELRDAGRVAPAPGHPRLWIRSGGN